APRRCSRWGAARETPARRPRRPGGEWGGGPGRKASGCAPPRPPARGAPPPPPLQGPGHEAVLRIDGPVAPLGILGVVPRALQPLPPVLVAAGAGPPDVLHNPADQNQSGRALGRPAPLHHPTTQPPRPSALTKPLGPPPCDPA